MRVPAVDLFATPSEIQVKNSAACHNWATRNFHLVRLWVGQLPGTLDLSSTGIGELITAGSRTVTVYRLYSIDRAGKIVGAEPLIAASDDEAFDRACALNKESDYEIWKRSKLVGISRRWIGKERSH